MGKRISLFESSSLSEELKKLEIEDLAEKMKILKDWNKNVPRYKQKKETQLQGLFFKEIFVGVLDYVDITTSEESWSIEYEESTDIDSTKPDGNLGVYNNAQRTNKAVIELKGLDYIDLEKKQKRSSKDYGTPIDQAYSYASKIDGCEWIIVSNMLEIRLYKNGLSQYRYETFFIPDLATNIEEFKRFYFLLSKKFLIENKKTLQLNKESIETKLKITDSFYNFYSQSREKLWESLKENNTGYDEIDLLEKAQKILNRMTFILFCEGNNLIVKGTLKKFFEEGLNSLTLTAWQHLQILFRYIDKGIKNQNIDINKFNGGLFKEDRILDTVYIPNSDLKILEDFFKYNFEDGLTIDVLGHIFEQSISDIEILKGSESSIGERKSNGIFYTPEYVTSFIVKQSIDHWIEEEKERLDFSKLKNWKNTTNKSWQTRYAQENIRALNALKESLANIKILDPTCGSGAFLTQVFDYLLLKHQQIIGEIQEIESVFHSSVESNVTLDLDLDRDILINNIFGVDLNKESVEITKLSLWLKTANKEKPLTTLDSNIIAGNTVIDDEELAVNSRINWKESFPEVVSKGGFDIVLGNPPYIPIDFLNKETIEYYYEEYGEILKNKWETSPIFMYKSAELLNQNGILSMIVPVTWLTGSNYEKFRKEFLNNKVNLSELIVMPFDVFKDAYVDTCIIIARKKSGSQPSTFYGYKYPNKERLSAITLTSDDMDEINLEDIYNHEHYKIFTSIQSYNLYNKIKSFLEDVENFEKLGDITISTQGPVESKFKYSQNQETEYHIPYLKKGQGYRYMLEIGERNYIDLSEKQTLIPYYTSENRLFARRIVNRQDRLRFCYAEGSLAAKKDLNPFVVTSDRIETKALYAILNSKLISYIYINFSGAALKDDHRQTSLTDLRELPIKIPTLEESQNLVGKVEELEDALDEYRREIDYVRTLIQSEMPMDSKLSNKLKTFYKLDRIEYMKEIKKVKNISKSNIRELDEIYEEYAINLKQLVNNIYLIDSEIENLVYNLYQLNPSEILEIDSYYAKFDNSTSLQLGL